MTDGPFDPPPGAPPPPGGHPPGSTPPPPPPAGGAMPPPAGPAPVSPQPSGGGSRNTAKIVAVIVAAVVVIGGGVLVATQIGDDDDDDASSEETTGDEDSDDTEPDDTESEDTETDDTESDDTASDDTASDDTESEDTESEDTSGGDGDEAAFAEAMVPLMTEYSDHIDGDAAPCVAEGWIDGMGIDVFTDAGITPDDFSGSSDEALEPEWDESDGEAFVDAVKACDVDPRDVLLDQGYGDGAFRECVSDLLTDDDVDELLAVDVIGERDPDAIDTSECSTTTTT